MSNKWDACLECKTQFTTKRRLFFHIRKTHNIDIREYVLKYIHNSVIPKCKCGCLKEVTWNHGCYAFNTFLSGHNVAGFRDPEKIPHCWKMLSPSQIVVRKEKLMPTIGSCCVCKTQIELSIRRKETFKELFCSIDCVREKWNRTHVTRVCENCKQQFDRPQSVKQTRFCSWKCYQEAGGPPHTCGTHGPMRGQRGTYINNDGISTFFDSKLELRRMKELSVDASVKQWTRSKHRIPWTDENGIQRTYYPDFDVLYVDGTSSIEEVKGVFDEASKMKIEAGRVYCKTNDIVYKVLNDRDMDDFETACESYENEYGMWTRATLESTFMKMAYTFSSRSTCIRLQVGAVFVDSCYSRVLCFGYNGGISGDNNQCESLKPGLCGCTHAEVNAMMRAMEPLNGSHMFITTAPCKACAKLIIARGISKVFYGKIYRDKSGILLLKKHGIDVIRWSNYVASCDKAFFAKQ